MVSIRRICLHLDQQALLSGLQRGQGQTQSLGCIVQRACRRLLMTGDGQEMAHFGQEKVITFENCGCRVALAGYLARPGGRGSLDFNMTVSVIPS
jgi:hypothetical protein